ncbi:hypothetical protein [Actinomadura chibensis]|uniref:nSTAND1 domain-containing NTPase n=1 Tax=Actinomadura chibensis TaxID=392828 RepID=UPI001471FCC2|nr:hypothetical protein [Actinomadura chibensis]
MIRWAGARRRRWTSAGLLSVLAAGALAPLLTSGVATAGLGAVAAVGGNVLTDVVKAGVARLGGGHSREDLEAELERGVQRILEDGGERADLLRAEIAEVLREVGAVGAAIEAVIETGDRRTQTELAAGLAAVGEEFQEFGFVLADLRVQLGHLREDIDRQGGRLRRQSAELRLAVDLGYRQATDTRLLLEQVAAIERRTRPRPGRAETGERRSGECPYRGLVAFTEADAGVFHGREVVTAQLVAKLAQRLPGTGPLVVTGASGAGKSSLLRAGLLPAIGRGELSAEARDWPRHVLDRPTGTPLARLAALIAGLAGLEAPGVLRSLAERPDEAGLLVRQAADTDARRRGLPGGAARLILVVDQFEELFTLEDAAERADAERDAFVTALHAATAPPADALVLIAVRGDFIDRCARHPLLAAALQDGPFIVGPMPAADLRRAITGPADAAGLEIEPGLIDTILSGLRSPTGGYDAGVLPLLSQTMLTIWEHREDDRLTGRGYALTGGVTEAVATSAEAAYTDLDDDQRRLTRHVFHRLTAVSRDGRLARRTVQRSDLRPTDADRPAVDRILDAFAARRLIVVDDTGVEIAHEALLHAWPRLRGWLDADLADHALYNQLQDAADEWAGHGHAASFLFRGERLAVVQSARARWQADPGRFPALTPATSDFLDASARAQVRARRRRRAVQGALSVLVVTALVFGTMAARSSSSARHQRDVALSRQLIAQSRLQTADPGTAALLGAAAWRLDPSPEARANLITLLAKPGRGVFASVPETVTSLELSPDGRTLLVGTLGELSFWDVRTRRRVGAPLTRPMGRAYGTFSPDGRVVATSSTVDHAVRLWDVRTRRQLGAPLPSEFGMSPDLVFQPGGGMLAVSTSGKVRLWDASTRRPIGRPLYGSGSGGGPPSVGFSPDGRTMAIGADGMTRLIDPRTREQIGPPIRNGRAGVDSVVFSPRGHMLAIIAGSAVRVWNVKTRKQIGDPFVADKSGVTSVAFSQDEGALAVGGDGNAVRLWNIGTRRQIGEPITGHTDSVTSLIFLDGGRTLITGSTDGTVRLWNPAAHRQIGDPLTGHRHGILAQALSRDGLLATGGSDETVRLWDLRGKRQLGAPLKGHADPVVSLAFAPDGRVLASANGNDKSVRLWDVHGRRQLGALILPGEYVSAVGFSPDGRTLVTGGGDYIRFWDVRTRRQIGAPVTGTGYSAAFSPDGRALATDDENTVRMWSAKTHEQIGGAFAGHQNPVPSVAFSPDGRVLASGGLDSTIRLWNVRTHRQIGPPLAGHHAFVSSVAFSRDGRFLASASGDGTIRLWDTETQAQLGEALTGHSGVVGGVAFSPDGRTLISSGADGTVRLWDVGTPPDLHAAVCSIAGRSLTREEWARYVPGQKFRTVC